MVLHSSLDKTSSLLGSKCLVDARGQRSADSGQAGRSSGWRSPSTEECSSASLIGCCSGGMQTSQTSTTPPTPFCLTSTAPSGGNGKHMILSRQQVRDVLPTTFSQPLALRAFPASCAVTHLSIFRWELELQPWAVCAAGRLSPVRHFNSSLVTAC